jgi:ABC-type polysaccharide/polyol phosphate export permease
LVTSDLGTAQRGPWASRLSGSFLHHLVARRGLVWAFAERDFRTRYRTSAVGWAWSLLQPLANLAVYGAVFSIVFTTQAPDLGNGHGAIFALFLFTGLVAWGLFAALMNLSMASLRESGSLLRKVAFPAWAPVLGSGLVQLIQVALESTVLLCWYIVVGNVGWTWVYAPFLLLGMALFAQGIGLALATLNARFGDVEYIVGVVLAALYFLTPILYPASQVPGGDHPWFRALVTGHPVAWFITGLHDSLYTLDGPGVVRTALLLIFGGAVFLGGLWIFDRTTEDIGELL